MKWWSKTKPTLALSSGEAELMALVKATTEAIGIAQLGEGWGIPLCAEVLVDSSAALAVTARKGNGRLRHVRIGHLWVQERAQAEDVRYSKVPGADNPADVLTKHLVRAQRERLLPLLSQWAVSGHAGCRLHLSQFICNLESRTTQRPRDARERHTVVEGECEVVSLLLCTHSSTVAVLA